jgi:glutamate dehydrogenase (NAD(P)+)
MTTRVSQSGVALHAYEDPYEGFKGFLAYSGSERPLAAGGMRVQRGLTAEQITSLARAMRRKEDALQVNVDGAKCGIDYDPRAPGKHAAMRRFLRFLAPHLRDRLSLGPDMGTTFREIEELARDEGIASVKLAIARAQKLGDRQVLNRLRTLDVRTGQFTLGERRAGHGLAHSAMAAARLLGARPPWRCALQGFGTLGRGAATTLHDAGALLVAVADEHGAVHSNDGLPIPRMLATTPGTAVADIPGVGTAAPRDSVLEAPADILLLAASENALGPHGARSVRARTVVVGSNDGLLVDQYEQLAALGVFAVPDFIAGAGGSASMDAIFAPAACPDPITVLAHVAMMAQILTAKTYAASMASTSPWTAALTLRRNLAPSAPPYALRTLTQQRSPLGRDISAAQRTATTLGPA